jgi:tetratricopeptide (TPR) repeat protein
LQTFVLSFALITLAIFHGQSVPNTPVSLDAGSPDLHIIKQTTPLYPPIAKAAHVSGQVKLQVEIGVDGRITNTRALTGPAMLFSAAQDCVKQWIYEPVIRDGKSVVASTTVLVSFELPASANPNDEQIASRFFPLQQACTRAVSSNADPAQQSEACKQAADVAQTFSSQERFIERRSAFVYASTAMRRNKQLKESLDYANKAISVIEQGHDDGSGSSAAYSVRAQAEAQLGDLTGASNDIVRAEKFERAAIAEMGKLNGNFTKHQYIPVLKGLLNFHAQILAAQGKTDEAQAALAEASKL